MGYPLIGSKGVAAASGSPAGGLPDVRFFLLSRRLFSHQVQMPRVSLPPTAHSIGNESWVGLQGEHLKSCLVDPSMLMIGEVRPVQESHNTAVIDLALNLCPFTMASGSAVTDKSMLLFGTQFLHL